MNRLMLPRTFAIVMPALMLCMMSLAAQAPRSLTEQDKADIQALVTGYAKALGSCDANGYADLFADDAYFASGFRGHVIGRDRLIAMVQSERQCVNPPAAARPAGATNGPTVAIDLTPAGVYGLADLGVAGHYEDEYVKTPKGWRFAGRTVITPAEKSAGLNANAMMEIRRLAKGTEEAEDFWAAGQDGVKRFRSSGVVITVMNGTVNGRMYLKGGGYYDDVYERNTQGHWRFRTRTFVPDARQ